jgi:hypothetical protein
MEDNGIVKQKHRDGKSKSSKEKHRSKDENKKEKVSTSKSSRSASKDNEKKMKQSTASHSLDQQVVANGDDQSNQIKVTEINDSTRIESLPITDNVTTVSRYAYEV